MIPGELLVAPGEIELNAGRTTVRLTVANTGDRLGSVWTNDGPRYRGVDPDDLDPDEAGLI